MKITLPIIVTLLFSAFLFAQKPEGNTDQKKVIVTGKVLDKQSKQPLEYATITLLNTKANKITGGGITDSKGEFKIEVNPGTYDITIEFISFKPSQIKAKSISENTTLGLIILEDNSQQLNEVIIRSEKTSVEIKLDKKIYNVGKDLMVKGGTVSDVLDNIPSVSVDVEGNISLRGNENVRVLIDGKPSNAINVAEALRLIPADAIDKVEVITNPSARYDAEGGGGLLNIILKKGKANGLNGVFLLTTGEPANHGVNATINFKSDEFNFYTTQGYSHRNSPGQSLVDTNYFTPRVNSPRYIREERDNDRFNKDYNGAYGLDWNMDQSTSWSNSVVYRKSSGENQDNVTFTNFYEISALNNVRKRINFEDSKSENLEFNSNFAKRFKRDGHKLNIDFQTSLNKNDNLADIFDTVEKDATTINNQEQTRSLIQLDYVLPFGKGNQFEAGYRGDFTKQTTDVIVDEEGVLLNFFSNILEYKEKVNAFYTQYGFKADKLSVLLGLRWEDSNIDVNQLNTRDFNNKRYNNFFPSAFLTYEIGKKTNISLSYSKRINRPRGRQLNPFSNFSSNINIFQGNPDLDPAMTNAFDLGFLKVWGKLTLNTSVYFNSTTDVFQFIRKQSGLFAVTVNEGADEIVNGVIVNQNGAADTIIPVILSTPINLSTEERIGFEFTLNYSPYKWWKLNGNFNYFNVKNKGDYSYINANNTVITQNFDNIASTWTTRLTSKVTLPYKIDWQTNMNYDGDQRTAQGKRIGIFAMNLAFSKDILKDKGTLSFNVSDVFNSRKRILEVNIPEDNIQSYNEFQFRIRQFTLSFTYRFNKSKNDREKPKRNQQDFEGGGDF